MPSNVPSLGSRRRRAAALAGCGVSSERIRNCGVAFRGRETPVGWASASVHRANRTSVCAERVVHCE